MPADANKTILPGEVQLRPKLPNTDERIGRLRCLRRASIRTSRYIGAVVRCRGEAGDGAASAGAPVETLRQL
jgi:hypothetical protein